MRLFIDECVWRVTRDYIKQLGHDIVGVEQCDLSGAEDKTVISKAVAENRAFLTRDMHFCSILLYPPENYEGIIVLKIDPSTIDQVHHTLGAALNHFTQESIQKSLVIVDSNKFRERR